MGCPCLDYSGTWHVNLNIYVNVRNWVLALNLRCFFLPRHVFSQG